MGFEKLSFPEIPARISQSAAGETLIWDAFRSKWVVCTPEEWVRQHCLHFLVKTVGYPKGRIAVEQKIVAGGIDGRFDAVVYDAVGQPFLLVECKAPHVKISQDTYMQAARYNQRLNVPYMLLTNGLQLWLIELSEEPRFLKKFPAFK